MTTVAHGDSRTAEDPKPPKGGRIAAVRSSLAAELWQNAGQYVISVQRVPPGIQCHDLDLNQNSGSANGISVAALHRYGGDIQRTNRVPLVAIPNHPTAI